MDINIVDQMINELKQCDTTYSNIKDLAALYIVKEKFNDIEKTSTEKELADILPAYQLYIDNKRKNQFGQVDENAVIYSLKMLCIETFQFIQVLYLNTNSNAERAEIKRCIDRLSKEL